MRWLLLDEITEIRKGISAKARSRIPSEKISTEVLLIEMMAQTAGVLLGAENDFKENVVFAKIETAEFPCQGDPGETVEIKVSSESLKPEGSWVDGTVENSRGIFSKAKLMLVNAGSLLPGKTESITFHKAFMDHFKVREKIK